MLHNAVDFIIISNFNWFDVRPEKEQSAFCNAKTSKDLSSEYFRNNIRLMNFIRHDKIFHFVWQKYFISFVSLQYSFI